MAEGRTYRQGRTVRVTPARRESDATVVLVLVGAIVGLAVPALLYQAESYYHELGSALTELDGRVIEAGPLAPASGLNRWAHSPVHFSSAWSGSVGDPAFGVALPHALQLSRDTEYCQWDEFSTESCDKCPDDTGEGEHDCNCVRTYHYTKGWRSHRIISLGFDQPANHHNPQRDPFPSARWVAPDAMAADVHLEPELLNNIKAPTRKVYYGAHTAPYRSWFFGSSAAPPRVESVHGLAGFLGTVAHAEHAFLYTNRDGWFFSPYERSAFEHYFRRLGQFIEGSLFDFQIGDVLFDTCTAGDIRVRYHVADPERISVAGKVKPDGRGGVAVGLIDGLRTTNLNVGFVHAGTHSFGDMAKAEYSEAYWGTVGWRVAALVWGLVVERLHERATRPAAHGSTAAAARSIDGATVLGAALLLVSLVWAITSGILDFSGASTSLWTVLGLVGAAALLHRGRLGADSCAKKME